MSEIDNFPAKKQRRSKLDDLPDAVLSGLVNMYGDFADELQDIGEFALRGESYAGKIGHALCSRNLRTGIRREIGEALHEKFPCLYGKVLRLRVLMR